MIYCQNITCEFIKLDKNNKMVCENEAIFIFPSSTSMKGNFVICGVYKERGTDKIEKLNPEIDKDKLYPGQIKPKHHADERTINMGASRELIAKIKKKKLMSVGVANNSENPQWVEAFAWICLVINRTTEKYNRCNGWIQKAFWINIEKDPDIDLIESSLDEQFRALLSAPVEERSLIVGRIKEGLTFYERRLASYFKIPKTAPKKIKKLDPLKDVRTIEIEQKPKIVKPKQTQLF